MHTHARTHARTHTHTHTSARTQAHTHTRVRTQTHTRTHTHTHTCVRKHTHHTHARANTHTHTRAWARKHTHTHTHSHCTIGVTTLIRAHPPDVAVFRMNRPEGALLPAALEAPIVTSYHRLGTRFEISSVASLALESREESTPHTLLRELAWSRQREMV